MPLQLRKVMLSSIKCSMHAMMSHSAEKMCEIITASLTQPLYFPRLQKHTRSCVLPKTKDQKSYKAGAAGAPRSALAAPKTQCHYAQAIWSALTPATIE